MRRRWGRTRRIDARLALAIVLGTLAANVIVYALVESFDREDQLRQAATQEVTP